MFAIPIIKNTNNFNERKLWRLNFTLYDALDSSAHCIMWDELKVARGGNEIASSILKWVDSIISGSEIEDILLW